MKGVQCCHAKFQCTGLEGPRILSQFISIEAFSLGSNLPETLKRRMREVLVSRFRSDSGESRGPQPGGSRVSGRASLP